MTYWSRSRNELWTKGLTSGHVQYVKSLTIDCDNDTILAKVDQVGAACHTGNRTCFFKPLMKKEYDDTNPLHVFQNVYDVITDRKANPKEGSYTNYLFDKGIDKILKKVGEECTEIVIAAKKIRIKEEIKYEISDFSLSHDGTDGGKRCQLGRDHQRTGKKIEIKKRHIQFLVRHGILIGTKCGNIKKKGKGNSQ